MPVVDLSLSACPMPARPRCVTTGCHHIDVFKHHHTSVCTNVRAKVVVHRIVFDSENAKRLAYSLIQGSLT
jgi:hypothetical protein